MTASIRKQEMAFRVMARTAGVYSEIHNSDKRIFSQGRAGANRNLLPVRRGVFQRVG